MRAYLDLQAKQIAFRAAVDRASGKGKILAAVLPTPTEVLFIGGSRNRDCKLNDRVKTNIKARLFGAIRAEKAFAEASRGM